MGDMWNKHENQLGRGLSYDLWKNFPAHEILTMKDHSVGIGWRMDPMHLPQCPVNQTTTIYRDGYALHSDSGEYVRPTLASEYDGVTALRIFSTNDNAEAWAQACNGGEPFVISDTAAECRDLVFECCFRMTNATTDKASFFIGLMEAGLVTNTIVDSAGGLIDKDLIGFEKPDLNDGSAGCILRFIYRKNGQAVTVPLANAGVVAALTWYRVGFRFNSTNRTVTPWFGTGDNKTTKFKPKASGVVSAANIAAATFPDGEHLAPIFGLKNAHADDFYIDIRAAACAQLAKAAD